MYTNCTTISGLKLSDYVENEVDKNGEFYKKLFYSWNIVFCEILFTVQTVFEGIFKEAMYAVNGVEI